MSKSEKIYNCGVEATIDVIGGKWKPIIVFHLLNGTKRFGELKKYTGDVTQRSLTLHLKELERDGIINREVYAEVPPKVEYSITEYGKTLQPLLHLMKIWGDSLIEKDENRKYSEIAIDNKKRAPNNGAPFLK